MGEMGEAGETLAPAQILKRIQDDREGIEIFLLIVEIFLHYNEGCTSF